MKEIVLGIWLLIQAGVDFRHKEISVKLSLVGIVMGLVFCVFERKAKLKLMHHNMSKNTIVFFFG